MNSLIKVDKPLKSDLSPLITLESLETYISLHVQVNVNDKFF